MSLQIIFICLCLLYCTNGREINSTTYHDEFIQKCQQHSTFKDVNWLEPHYVYPECVVKGLAINVKEQFHTKLETVSMNKTDLFDDLKTFLLTIKEEIIAIKEIMATKEEINNQFASQREQLALILAQMAKMQYN